MPLEPRLYGYMTVSSMLKDLNLPETEIADGNFGTVMRIKNDLPPETRPDRVLLLSLLLYT